VLVPNLCYRHGPAPVIELPEHIGEEIRPAVVARLMPLVEAHTTERVLRDADACLRFLTTQPEVSAGPVAVIGYCIGAALAMRTAAAHPGQVAAVAGFHPGFLVTDAPDSPHRLVPKLTAQVHLGLSGNDMRSEAISELNQALDAAGRLHLRDLPRHHPRLHDVGHRGLQPLRAAAPPGPSATPPRPHPGQQLRLRLGNQT
jgi:carboxymethylenebutenolidase